MLAGQQTFLTALAENEDDDITRLVYSDFLEENGLIEEAERMRAWRASKTWMQKWVRSINYVPYKKDDQGKFVEDASGDLARDEEGDNYGDPHTYEDAIEAGIVASRGDVYTWGTDAGQDFFHEDKEGAREWWRHWSILTGNPVPTDRDFIDLPPFRCSC